MNLYELIQQIPNFIVETLKVLHDFKKKQKDANPPMIGKFYLGLSYDY